MKKLLIILAMLGCYLITFLVQVKINEIKTAYTYVEGCSWCPKDKMIHYDDVMYIPTGKFLNLISLGYNHFLADLLWLKVQAYYGEHSITDQKYDWLYHMLDIITTLDPDYYIVYKLGGIALSLEKQVDESNRLLIKGHNHLKNKWYLPFLLGYNYAFHLNTPDMAAKYMSEASMLPRSPGYVKTLTATLYNEANDPDAAVMFLKQLSDVIEDEKMRHIIKERLRLELQNKGKKRVSKDH